MDPVHKDRSLFAVLAARCGVAIDLALVIVDVVTDALHRYGPRERSPNVVRRLENPTGLALRTPGFPPISSTTGRPSPGAR
ncbi:MAG TPA: hypothetical protein VK923_01965 [Euzebyales bacterium]|nr:hypothetical protein [Euzebyales bacterium]